jgi:hypothetical protein
VFPPHFASAPIGAGAAVNTRPPFAEQRLVLIRARIEAAAPVFPSAAAMSRAFIIRRHREGSQFAAGSRSVVNNG